MAVPCATPNVHSYNSNQNDARGEEEDLKPTRSPRSLPQLSAGELQEDVVQAGPLQGNILDAQRQLQQIAQAFRGMPAVLSRHDELAIQLLNDAKALAESRPVIGIGLLQVSLQHKQLIATEAFLKFRQRAFGQQSAVIDDADANAQRLRFLQVVRCVKDCRAFGTQLAHEFENVRARLRVDANGRLVQEQQFGPMHERATDVNAPLHTT